VRPRRRSPHGSQSVLPRSTPPWRHTGWRCRRRLHAHIRRCTRPAGWPSGCGRRSLQQIADEVGCSTGAVRTAVRSLGIADRRGHAERRFAQLHDHRWLRRRYLNEARSSTAIAAEIGCGSGTVVRALHRAGIEVRSGPKARRYLQLHNIAWLRRRAVGEGASTAQLVAEIGGSRTSVHRVLHRAGIDISERTSTKYPHLRSRVWLRRAYVTEQLAIAQIADQLGCQKRTVRDALRRARIAVHPSEPSHDDSPKPTTGAAAQRTSGTRTSPRGAPSS
jgi:hypothetical protein